MESHERLALERLIQIAKRDTGQGRRVANFLLSWWNVSACGGWAVTEIWHLSSDIVDDIFVVLAFMSEGFCYPDSLGYHDDFQEILKQWRLQIFNESTEEKSQ